MFSKIALCALASAAMIPAAAIAQHGPGGGGGPPSGIGGAGNAGGFGHGGPGGFGPGGAGGFGPGGPFGAGNESVGGMSGMGSSMRDQGRMNSQGPANASAIGIAHANQNSVLYGTTPVSSTVTSGAFAGLSTGTTLYSNGTAVGQVAQIRTNGQGGVAIIVVKGTNGGYYAVPANKLTFSGGTLSTTARLAGINTSTTTASNTAAPTTNANTGWRANSQGPAHASAMGIAHANQHSVLYGSTATTSTRGTRPTTSASNTWRTNSRGPIHASATGIAHANSRSVLAGGSTSTLSNVSVGMPLMSNGTQVGTVYRLVTANGVITRVLVQGTNGRIYSLSPATLTASGGSVMTSASLHGI